jgi:ABC-type Fe3+ transport system permease subunit
MVSTGRWARRAPCAARSAYRRTTKSNKSNILRRSTAARAERRLEYAWTLNFKVLSLPVLLGHAGTEVMPVLIFDLYEAGQYTRLNALGVVVVVLVTALSLIARRVSRRFGLEDIH